MTNDLSCGKCTDNFPGVQEMSKGLFVVLMTMSLADDGAGILLLDENKHNDSHCIDRKQARFMIFIPLFLCRSDVE